MEQFIQPTEMSSQNAAECLFARPFCGQEFAKIKSTRSLSDGKPGYHISLGFLAQADTFLYVTKNVIIQMNLEVKFRNLHFLNCSKSFLTEETFSFRIMVLSVYLWKVSSVE